MRRYARTAVVLALTLGLLVFFLRGADLAGVWAEARSANGALLLFALAFTGLTYVLRALRWQYLLAPIGRTHFRTAFRTTIIGFAASGLLPARAGEFLRPYLLAREERLSATAAFATVVLERLLDLVTVVVLFAAFALFFDPGFDAVDPRVYGSVKIGGVVAGLGAGAALAVGFALAGHPERVERAMLGINRLLPERLARTVARFVATFARGFTILRQPRRLVVALVLSIPLWLSIAAGIWLTSLAFHITFAFPGSFLVTAMLVVGVAAPTPGAVGGFHLAYKVAVMTFYNAPADRATGAAVVLHAISFLPVTAVGSLLMMRDGLGLARIRRLTTVESGAVSDAAPEQGAA